MIDAANPAYTFAAEAPAMCRPSELFAVAAIVLLAIGVAVPKLSIAASVYLSVHSRAASYEVPPQAIFFGLAALFGVFAFVYALWMLRMNHSAAVWHFWLSAIGIVFFGMGLAVFATMPRGISTSFMNLQRTAAVVGTFSGCLFFFGAQLVFVTNLIFAFIHGSPTS